MKRTRRSFWELALLAIVTLALTLPFASMAQDDEEEDEEELSLTELSNLKPPSLIVDVDKSITYDLNPSSVTVITARDIELSPVRDMYDLIETYVPGAWWMAHNEGAHAGFRGIINDRNTKMLLVVNGVVMNEKFANGVTSEMENWDLSDIERIEIIRGPGSVTFGPGAVSGVVSITTKRPTVTGSVMSVKGVTGYDSKGFALSSNIVRDNYKISFNGSITSTEGLNAPKAFGADRGTPQIIDKKTGDTIPERLPEYGYWGDTTFKSNLGRPVLNFYQDYRHEPQIKAMVDISFLENARLWARYTSMGDVGLHGFAEGGYQSELLTDGRSVNVPLNGPGDMVIDSMFISNPDATPFVNLRGRHVQQFSSNLENKFKLTENLSLNARAYVKSTDVTIQKGHRSSISWENAFFLRYDEQEANIRAILNYNIPLMNLAIGMEYNHTRYDTGWGGEDVYLTDILQRPATPQNIPTEWKINMGSILGEALLNMDKISEALKGQHILVSGRFDLAGDSKGELYSAPLISPRVAWIGDFGTIGTFKLIGQQSNRMGNSVELYNAYLAGEKADAELLRGGELIYQKKLLENKLALSGSGYYNSIETMGWSTAANSTVLLGTVDILGGELDARYRTNKFMVGGNIGITKMMGIVLEEDNIDPSAAKNKIRSGMTFAEYNYVVGDPGSNSTMLLKSEGDNLANTPNFIAKLFGNYKVYESSNPWAQALTLHGDLHVLGDWSGEQEGLDMIEKTAAGTTLEGVVGDFLDTLDAHKIYTADVRFNFSLEYKLLNNFLINGYVLNLFGSNDNKRYQYSSGHQHLVSPKANWNEEPRVVGLKASYKF